MTDLRTIDVETGEIVEPLTEDEARALTDRIAHAVETTWELVVDAYQRRAWAALGYESWDAYCSAEFSSLRLRLPREERAEQVASLRESGLSLRAIAAATGVSEPTVRRDLAGASNDAPQRVTGQDGKSHPTTRYYSCPDCGKTFERRVWHCGGCDAHFGQSEPCGNGCGTVTRSVAVHDEPEATSSDYIEDEPAQRTWTCSEHATTQPHGTACELCEADRVTTFSTAELMNTLELAARGIAHGGPDDFLRRARRWPGELLIPDPDVLDRCAVALTELAAAIRKERAA